jgi:hypothetical protein
MFSSYIDAPWSAHVAACIFAGSCLSLTSLVGVETPIAFALQSAAAVTGPPSRATLERVARAHRPSLGTSNREKWRDLVRVADQRAALSRAKAASEADRQELDEQIEALAGELAPLQAISSATPDAATPDPAAPDPATPDPTS